MRAPELLSPAGNLRNLRYALAYGADAVYAGQPRYSLRVRNNDFDKLENLALGIGQTHALGKQFYLAVNLLPHNAKLKTFLHDLAPAVALGPDALIMADPGLIMLVRERWPELPIHLSVQANTLNSAAVRFWRGVGISRVILSRELSLDEIEEVRQQCPDTELEVFVHGALCIAYSGRCLLSGYMNHRDPNQGTCTNACRWEYKALPAQEDSAGDLRLHQPSPVLLEEGQRPGEYMPVYEDEHGTYIMNSKDLRAVQHVGRLARIGIDCLKIEGRTKSHYYTARTAQVYRRAIDAAVAGEAFDFALLDDLENLANRGYTEGFYRRHAPQETQNYASGGSDRQNQLFVGEVLDEYSADGWLHLDIKNKLSLGDAVELMLPQGNLRFVLEQMRDRHGQPAEVAPGSGHQVRVATPARGDVRYALLLKQLTP